MCSGRRADVWPRIALDFGLRLSTAAARGGEPASRHLRHHRPNRRRQWSPCNSRHQLQRKRHPHDGANQSPTADRPRSTHGSVTTVSPTGDAPTHTANQSARLCLPPRPIFPRPIGCAADFCGAQFGEEWPRGRGAKQSCRFQGWNAVGRPLTTNFPRGGAVRSGATCAKIASGGGGTTAGD